MKLSTKHGSLLCLSATDAWSTSLRIARHNFICISFEFNLRQAVSWHMMKPQCSTTTIKVTSSDRVGEHAIL